MRASSSWCCSWVAVVAAGCGGDNSQAIDAATAVVDAKPCTVSTASFGDLGALPSRSAFYTPSPLNASLGDIITSAHLSAGTPYDSFFGEFRVGHGPFGTSAAPTAVVAGTYTLQGPELQYQTCGLCVRIGTRTTATSYADEYLATGGTVTITTAGTADGQTVTFSLANVTFEHVRIDSNTQLSTPAGDGCTSSLASATFSSTLQ